MFVLGIFFGLYLQQFFVGMLPGPKVYLEIQGMRPTAGNPVGCILYEVDFKTDKPIEYVYAKIQFPNLISDYEVGTPLAEAQTEDRGRVNVWLFAADRNEKGECEIKASLSRSVDVQASAAGNMITIHASKLPPKAILIEVVATPEQQSAVKPSPRLYVESACEYTKLGLTVRKPLRIIDKGIVDLKETAK